MSNSTLAAVCVYSGIHRFLLFESDLIAKSIQAYSELLENARRADEIQAENEGRMPGQYWVDIEQPKASSPMIN